MHKRSSNIVSQFLWTVVAHKKSCINTRLTCASVYGANISKIKSQFQCIVSQQKLHQYETYDKCMSH